MPEESFQFPAFFRAASLDAGKLDPDERTMPLAFSSEAPVLRTFPGDYPDKRVAGKTFHEVLDHGEGACDLSLLSQRAPLLVDHDPKQHAGVILNPALGGDRIARASAKFSRSPLGERELNDVKDGIRSKVSAGYRIQRARIEPPGDDGIPVLRATKWQPYEVSTVSLPADANPRIGFGRAVDSQNLTECLVERAAPAGNQEPSTKNEEPLSMITTATVTEPVIAAPDIKIVREAARKDELIRSNEIRAHVAHWKNLGFDMAALADAAITDGHDVPSFQRAAFEHAQKTKPLQVAHDIGLNEGEKRRYSLCRAVTRLAGNQPLDGFELECSRAVEKQTGTAPQGFYIPNDISIDLAGANRGLSRALNVTTATQGGNTVQTDVLGGSMIEILRNKQFIRKLGAYSMDGLVGNAAIPRQTGAATGYSVSENGALTGSTQAIGQLALTPHRIGAFNDYSKQLLAQSSIDVENFVRMDLMQVLAILSDYYAIAGSGASNQPTGILSTAGIGSVTFGGAANWANILKFETEVAVANADEGALAYLTSPAARAKLKAATKIAGSQYSDFIWEKGGAPGEGIVNSYRACATNQMTQAGDLLIFGNFADIILAGWAGLDVVIDPYTQATLGLVRITVNQFMDVGIRHSASFSASADSAAQ